MANQGENRKPLGVQRESNQDAGNTAEFPRENVSATVSPYALDYDAESIMASSPSVTNPEDEQNGAQS